MSANDLFHAALAVDPQQRVAWLAAHCPNDPALRARVASLLAWHDRAGDFLERPILVGAENLCEALQSPPVEGDAEYAAADSPGEVTTKSFDAPPAGAMIGREIGRYTIRRLIASGGMGTVYEAQQKQPRRPVALKLMKSGIASKSALRRFEYEAQLLARLRHPGIAQVFEAGTHDDGAGPVPFFAMEYIPQAVPITEYASANKLTTRQRLELFAKVCDAVYHGHQKGIIHRDLKPSNILVDSAGQPKVIDFGVAESTDSDMALTTVQTSVGQLIGTLQYMSPEQCAADPHDIDTRSDVYGLGIVLYELLCGKPPYDVSRVAIHEATRVIREQQPFKMSSFNKTLRGDLETIVLKALEKDRKRRYQSANDLGQDIHRFLKSEPIQARPPSAIYLFRSFARRNRVAVAGVAGIILALTAGLISSTRLYLRSEDARKEADAAAKFLGGMIADVDPRRGDKDVTVREVLDRASSSVGEKLKDHPLVEAYLRQMMADSYLGLGFYNDAIKQASAAEKLRRRALGDEHPLRLESLSLLAVTLLWQGKRGEAAEALNELLPLTRRVFGDDHPSTLETLSTQAVLLQQQGHLEEAETLGRDVLARRRRVLGEDHPDTLMSAYRVAELAGYQGRFPEAEAQLRAIVDQRRRVMGNEHPDTLDAMNYLASILGFQGMSAEAADLCRETLEIRRRMLGDDHPATVFSRAGLAAMNLQRGRYGDAELELREVLAYESRHLGNDHPESLNTTNELAEALIGQAKYAEGDVLLQQVLERRRRILGEENHATLVSMHNVAHVKARQGRDREAQELFLETRETRIKVIGEEHVDTQDITNCTAWWLLTCKSQEFRDPQKALTLAKHAVELSKRKNPYYLETLALAQYRTGNLEQAVDSHAAALALLPSGLEPIDCELKQIVAKHLTRLNEDLKVAQPPSASPDQAHNADAAMRTRLLASLEGLVHLLDAGDDAKSGDGSMGSVSQSQ